MKQLVSILVLIICISCKNDKELPPFLEVDVTQDIVIPKKYIVTKTKRKIIVDGMADEASWKSALFTDNFIDIEGVHVPKYDTKIKMLWDDIYLYVYSEMLEPHIWANLKQRDTIIFYNNDFEVFIDPSGEARTYGEIEINALNTVWDLLLDKPYRVGGQADFEWNLNDLQTAVQIYGTLNNPEDRDSLWTVEMAIPLKPFLNFKNKSGVQPEEGAQWRINFSRVEWDHDIINGRYSRKKENGTYSKEYNWVWSNQKVINMHEPEKWGFLQFTEASSPENIIFIEDPDLLLKQTAFALFRKTRYGDLKHLLENEAGIMKIIKVTYSDGKTVETTFHKTPSGFEFTLGNSNSKTKYSINEEGILSTL